MAMLTRKKENFTIGAKIKNLNVYENKSVIYNVNSDEILIQSVIFLYHEILHTVHD